MKGEREGEAIKKRERELKSDELKSDSIKQLIRMCFIKAVLLSSIPVLRVRCEFEPTPFVHYNTNLLL